MSMTPPPDRHPSIAHMYNGVKGYYTDSRGVIHPIKTVKTGHGKKIFLNEGNEETPEGVYQYRLAIADEDAQAYAKKFMNKPEGSPDLPLESAFAVVALDMQRRYRTGEHHPGGTNMAPNVKVVAERIVGSPSEARGSTHFVSLPEAMAVDEKFLELADRPSNWRVYDKESLRDIEVRTDAEGNPIVPPISDFYEFGDKLWGERGGYGPNPKWLGSKRSPK